MGAIEEIEEQARKATPAKKAAAPKPSPAEALAAVPMPEEVNEEPEPTIGRIVLYVTGELTIRPAIITRVNEGSVDLTVFNSQGAVPATNVEQEPVEAEVPNTYHWPTR